MKLVYSNGKKLEIYDLGEPLMKFRAGAVPIKYNGYRIVKDEVAKDIARDLLSLGVYKKE